MEGSHCLGNGREVTIACGITNEHCKDGIAVVVTPSGSHLWYRSAHLSDNCVFTSLYSAK